MSEGQWLPEWHPLDEQVVKLADARVIVFGPGPRTWTVDSIFTDSVATYTVLGHSNGQWHLKLKGVR